MLGAFYKTKKELRGNIGKPLSYIETSMFSTEYRPNGTLYLVGPDPYKNREWFASVVMANGIIQKVG